jgi:magnesium transporter
MEVPRAAGAAEHSTTTSSDGAYEPESAGEHIVTKVLVAHEPDRIGEVLSRVMGERFDALDAMYVVDADDRLLGAVRLSTLDPASMQQSAGELVDRDYPRVPAHHDQEDVAGESLRRGVTSVAVVDADGRLLGVVPASSLLTILRHEHVEDLHRLSGMQRERTRVRLALEAPPTRRARHRLPWLLVGLVGSMLAAGIVSRFERVLERNLAVTFFVPAIVYLADAIGTQTEAIVVRGLSLERLSLRALLGSEVRTGLLIGLTMSVLAFPLVLLGFGDGRLGIAVSAAILVAGGVATAIGLVLPWIIQRLGSDPAFGSGPVATIIQDVLSVGIYLEIASLVL